MIDRLPLLATGVDLVDEAELVSWLLQRQRRMTIANHNLHSLALTQEDPQLQKFFRAADLVFIDGMPIVWLLKARGEAVAPGHRTTGLDWLPRFLSEAAERGIRVFHLGGTPLVASFCRAELPARFSGLQVEAHHGYFDSTPRSEESLAVVRGINDFAPDVLLVGMGMPRQERWVADNRAALSARVVCTIGGTMSYYVGEQATPPRWLGRYGLEGAYRLLRNPRRLAGRYVREPIGLALPIARDFRQHRRSRRRR